MMRSQWISISAYWKDIFIFVASPIFFVALVLLVVIAAIPMAIVGTPIALVAGLIGDILQAIDNRSSLDWKRKRLRDLIDGGGRQIGRAPGWRLYRIAGWFYSRRTFQEVFVPVLSDMQVEYFDALSTAQPWKARWVRVKGCALFLSHVAAQFPVSLGRILGLTGWRSPL